MAELMSDVAASSLYRGVRDAATLYSRGILLQPPERAALALNQMATAFEDERTARKAAEEEIASLRVRAERAEAALAGAREALEWYGEQARLARLIHREGDAGRHALSDDGGKRARAILALIAQPAPEPVERAEGGE